MNDLKPVRLSELKTRAVFLLKDLRSNSDLSLPSARRLLQTPEFSGKKEQWLIEHSGEVQLKHAYRTLALEYGYKNWADLKEVIIENDCLYRAWSVAFLHEWFESYREAKAYHIKNGGYLLAFWKDFVVCGKEYINCIGLSNCEEQWKKIGYDWVRPANPEVFKSLKSIARNNYLAQQ